MSVAYPYRNLADAAAAPSAIAEVLRRLGAREVGGTQAAGVPAVRYQSPNGMDFR